MEPKQLALEKWLLFGLDMFRFVCLESTVVLEPVLFGCSMMCFGLGGKLTFQAPENRA